MEIPKKQCDTLTLIYMAADNNLAGAALDDIEEMKEAVVGTNSTVLVFCDCDYTSTDGENDWNEARLYEMEFTAGNKPSLTELSSPELGVSTEWYDDAVDSGNADVLRSFINYARSHYSALSCNLVLWNHGGGWKSGQRFGEARSICSDAQSESSLSMQDLHTTLAVKGGIHFDTVILDACSMACLEVCAAFAGCTDVLVFSQDVVPEGGMPYEEVLPLLCLAEEPCEYRAKKICEAYLGSYPLNQVTVSAVRIDSENSYEKLCKALENFFLSNDFTGSFSEGRLASHEFLPSVVDIKFLSECDMRIEASLEKMMLLSEPNSYSGLSVFFPLYGNYNQDFWEYTPEMQPFLADCPSYRAFLCAISDDEEGDTFEPNNHKCEAHVVKVGESVKSRINCAEDVDWYLVKEERGVSEIEIVFSEGEFLSAGVEIGAERNVLLRLTAQAAGSNRLHASIPNEYRRCHVYIRVHSPFGICSYRPDYVISAK